MSGKDFEIQPKLSCENYVIYNNLPEFLQYLSIAQKMNINLMVVENLTREENDHLVNSDLNSNFVCKTLDQFFLKVINMRTITERYTKLKSFFTNQSNQTVIATRKTIAEQSLSLVRKILAKNRQTYDILSIYLNDRKIAKWAAHDGRVDYLTVNLYDSRIIDPGLCSLAKQHKKFFELPLSPLLHAQNQRDLSRLIRNGRKLIDLFTKTGSAFILTMKPLSPFFLRSGSQMRHLGTLLSIPFNESVDSVFNRQLKILTNNLSKLHSSYLFEGVEEVEEYD